MPDFEIRLVFLCGHVWRTTVGNEPAPEDVEMRSEVACIECQRGGKPLSETLEMMAEAAQAMKRIRPRGRKINTMG